MVTVHQITEKDFLVKINRSILFHQKNYTPFYNLLEAGIAVGMITERLQQQIHLIVILRHLKYTRIKIVLQIVAANELLTITTRLIGIKLPNFISHLLKRLPPDIISPALIQPKQGSPHQNRCTPIKILTNTSTATLSPLRLLYNPWSL